MSSVRFVVRRFVPALLAVILGAVLPQAAFAVTASSVDDLALDGAGHPVLLFEGNPAGLGYATPNGGSWNGQPLTSRNGINQPRVAVDPTGHGHVIWTDAGTTYLGIFYATNKSGTWVAQRLFNDPHEAYGAALAVDADGYFHIAWSGGFEGEYPGVWYATNKGGYLRVTLLYDKQIDGPVEIAVSSTGHVHLTWSGGDCAVLCGVFYNNNEGGTWHPEMAYSGAGFPLTPRIGVDSSGKAHIVGYQATSKSLVELSNATGSWTTRSLATSLKQPLFDAAFGPAGVRDVAYVSSHPTVATSYEVWVAQTDVNPIQAVRVTDRQDSIQVARVQIAVAGNGTRHLAFTGAAGESSYGSDGGTGTWSLSSVTYTDQGKPAALSVPTTMPLYGGKLTTDGKIPVATDFVPLMPPQTDCYAVQRKTDAGAFAAAGPATTCQQPGLVDKLAPGHVYQWRARSTYWDDWLGTNTTSGWYTGPAKTLTRLEENSTRLVYKGTWTRSAVSGTSGGYYKSSIQKGASVSITSTASSFGLVSKVGPGFGRADVYIDGNVAGWVDLYNPPGSITRIIVLSFRFLDNASHTVKFVVKASAGHPRFDVDAVVLFE